MSSARDRAYGRKHYRKNAAARKASALAWREANRDRYNASMREMRARRKRELIAGLLQSAREGG